MTWTSTGVAARTVAVAGRSSTHDISPNTAPGWSIRAKGTPSFSTVTEPEIRTSIREGAAPSAMRTSPSGTDSTGRSAQYSSMSAMHAIIPGTVPAAPPRRTRRCAIAHASTARESPSAARRAAETSAASAAPSALDVTEARNCAELTTQQLAVGERPDRGRPRDPVQQGDLPEPVAGGQGVVAQPAVDGHRQLPLGHDVEGITRAPPASRRAVPDGSVAPQRGLRQVLQLVGGQRPQEGHPGQQLDLAEADRGRRLQRAHRGEGGQPGRR